MSENLTITSERVDDIPLLLAQLDRMQVAQLLNEYFPTHGNWQGLSLGQLTSVWLSFILSQANHRLSHVEPWAEQHLRTLEVCLGKPVRALDFSDDRLAAVLDYLSDDTQWAEFERALNEQTLRVYDLQPQRVRIDSTTAKGYGEVTTEGLFQFGHSKDHRPDLPQVKINLSVLDPLGLPVTTTVVAGERADDPLYVPEIQRVQQSVGRQGLTYIGDCKMAALQTRAYVAASGNYYLCPLSSTQVSAAQLQRLLEPLWQGRQKLQGVYRPATGKEPQAEPELIAQGFARQVRLSASVEGRPLTWTERQWVVRSVQLAQAQEKSLRTRLGKALEELAELNVQRQGKKRFTQETEARAAAEKILTKHRLRGLIALSYTLQSMEREVRAYGERPARVEVQRTVRVRARVAQAALAQAIRSLGWRVYATNHEARQFSLEQAVWAYRAQYLVERGLGRLKGHPLSLQPMYLDTDERVTGLIRLLMIGLRVLTLVEFGVRQHLEKEGSKLAGIYPGNPTRATARPSTELMLRAFEGLTLTGVEEARRVSYHLTPLSLVQQRILELLGFAPEVYLHLSQHFSKPVLNLSEP